MNRTGVSETQIVIGEQSYRLRYSIRAIAALQQHWDLESFDAVGDKLNGIGKSGRVDELLDDLSGILWAGLRAHHPEIDKAGAIDLIDEMGLGRVGEITTAIAEALPQQEEEAGGPATTRPPNRGRSRGS